MPDSAKTPRPLLLVIPTVHLDSQWRWTIQDTIREFLPRTLRENFALFESHPHYQLNFEGAFRYMLVKEYYPEEFEELKRWVAAGRWHPVGAMLDAPDVNIASPESLIRHILYGNAFFRDELGRASRDLFLPDCFGFGLALPSVAAHCGLESISTSKLIKWKAPGEIPFEIGRWRGPDGAEIVAAIQPGGYGEGIDEDLSRSAEWSERIERLGKTSGAYLGLRYVGTGDRGGSPDRASLDHLERSITADGPLRVECAAADSLVARISPEQRQRLPLHQDELLLPTHGTGCWTAQAALKRWNRDNEILADSAERAAVVADWLGALDYPRERLRDAWIRFLWHQMHDDLTGTSIPAAYRFTWNDEAIAANLFAGVLTDSVAAVARELDTTSPGTPLVVFNPLGRKREDVIEALLEGDDAPADTVVVRDPSGNTLPCQIKRRADGSLELIFVARLEPVSFTVFEVITGDSSTGDTGASEPRALDHHLENHRYRVEIDEAGDPSSIFDKQLQREVLDRPMRLELLRNRSMRWPAWEIRPETVLQRDGLVEVGGPAEVRVVESGPVRAAIEVRRRALGSTFTQTLSLSAGAAGDRLEISNVVEWKTRGRLLKASFPLAASNPEAIYDLGLGVVRRGNNLPVRYEVPAQRWVSLSDTGGRHGAAILSDSKYGWDKPGDNHLRLSLVHAPWSLRKYPHQRTQDQGRHRFRYALMGHGGDRDRPQVAHQAASFNQPPLAFVAAPSHGRLGRAFSFLQLDDTRIRLGALKKGEQNDAYILRLLDDGGNGAPELRIRLPGPVLEAYETDGSEQRRGAVEVDGQELLIRLGANGVRTLAARVAPAAEGAQRSRQQALQLPWDHRATSFHTDEARVDFDGSGHSLPGELLPKRISMGGIDFDLGPTEPGAPNALRCSGQEIPVEPGFERLWLLAATIGTAAEGTFTADARPIRLRVASWTGWLAERPRPSRWGGLVPARPGFLERDQLAWLGTHRHTRKSGRLRDEPYVFCYLFRYPLDLPPGTTALRLPDRPSIRLFAATLSERDEIRLRPTRPLYG